MFLSQHNDLKIAFNSLCGYASVNHLHFHVYYQSNPLPVQHLPLTRVSSTCHVYTLAQDTYPAPAWVWLISRRDVDKISGTAAQLFKLTNWLTRQDVAHNVFITRYTDDDTATLYRYIIEFHKNTPNIVTRLLYNSRLIVGVGVVPEMLMILIVISELLFGSERLWEVLRYGYLCCYIRLLVCIKLRRQLH